MFLLTARDTVMSYMGETCISGQQKRTAHGSMGGGFCILPQSYFLVLIAETLGYGAGILSIKCIM